MTLLMILRPNRTVGPRARRGVTRPEYNAPPGALGLDVCRRDGVGAGCGDLHDGTARPLPDAGAEPALVEAVDERVVGRATLHEPQALQRRVGVLADADRVAQVLRTTRRQRDHVPGRDVLV